MKIKKWLNKTILGFGLTSFFNDFSHEMATAILPAFVESLVGSSSAPIALGVISSISNTVSTITKLLSGLLSNKINLFKPILVLGYALTPIFSGLIGLAKNIYQVLLFKSIAWAGRGLREPIRDTWLSKAVEEKFYGVAFGFTRALDTLGAISGPLVAYFALKKFKLNTIFFISFIPGIFSILSVVFLLESKSLKDINKQNRSSYWFNFFQLPKNFINFIFIMTIFSIGNFNKTLIIYRAQEVILGYSSSTIIATSWAILLYVFFNIIRALSEYYIGKLSDYFNRKKLLAFLGFGLFSIMSLCLITNSNNLLIWFLIFFFAGISVGTITTLQKAYAAQLLPENNRGLGFSLLETANGIGDLLSSLIVGILWSKISPTAGFIYAASSSFIASLLLLISK